MWVYGEWKKSNMDNSLYSKLSEVCREFYKLYFPHQKIAAIINNYLKRNNCKRIVFIGGLVHVAKILQSKGYEITFVDYTEEMIKEAQKVLSNMKFVVSDMRDWDLDEKYDAIVLMGRILTYMYTDKDVQKTLTAFKNNLKEKGVILIDNYEEGKIDQRDYFNGTVEVKDNTMTIRRISSMQKIQSAGNVAKPNLYKWDCVYEEIINGKKRSFEDKNHILRAFSRDEMKKLIEDSGLKFVENASNFEERSFVTVSKKISR